ncbi:MAG: CAP domain-containing protein [Candidatus Saccharimonadales bacterium]
MTLTNHQKPKPNIVQKKRGANHHRKSKDYHKAYWPYLPILTIVVVGVLLNTFWMNRGVLTYAVDTSPAGLLTSTNQERSANGLGALALNAALNDAASAKALDMATRNYWSHNTPDGEEPWVFVNATGYQYKTAGENLAYGFATSADTVAAWMNSPGHRANILNSTYTEVGFGTANSANYQGHGNQTIVVAFYASPLHNVANNTTTNTQPQAAAAAPSSTGSNTPATPILTEEPATPVPSEEIVVNQQAETPVAAQQTTTIPSTTSKNVSRVQVAGTGNMPWIAAILALLVVALGSWVIFKHGHAWRKVIVHGEQFVLRHKILDTVVVAVIVGSLLLIQTVGFIQ